MLSYYGSRHDGTMEHGRSAFALIDSVVRHCSFPPVPITTSDHFHHYQSWKEIVMHWPVHERFASEGSKYHHGGMNIKQAIFVRRTRLEDVDGVLWSIPAQQRRDSISFESLKCRHTKPFLTSITHERLHYFLHTDTTKMQEWRIQVMPYGALVSIVTVFWYHRLLSPTNCLDGEQVVTKVNHHHKKTTQRARYYWRQVPLGLDTWW